jgi:hypothetical protein
MAGICAQCKKGKTCGFRQPGTWVDDCALFEQKRQSTKVKALPEWLELEDASSDGNRMPLDLVAKGYENCFRVNKKMEMQSHAQKTPPT